MLLRPGAILALIGELGCGKTLMTRGICAGIGVPERQVNSPTYVLVNEYLGKYPVYHFDLYRIEAGETLEIDLPGYLKRGGSGVLIIEWAEKVLSLLPEGYLRIDFTVLEMNEREIILSSSNFNYLFGKIGAS